jgi:hypothetical protein
MAGKKKSPWARMGDMKQLDYATVSKMDPDQPNLYYGTEDMAQPDAADYNTLRGLESKPDPNETIESRTRRVVAADTPEAVAHRKKSFWSVLHPGWKSSDQNFPVTRFSPALGHKTGKGALGRTERPVGGGQSHMYLPANDNTLTTAMTSKHEMAHTVGHGHNSEEDIHLMSSPSDMRSAATDQVLRKLMAEGVPEDEASAMIVNDLTNPREVLSIGGLYDYETGAEKDDRNSWGTYVEEAPNRLKNLRTYRNKHRKKDAPLDLFSRTAATEQDRNPYLMDLMNRIASPKKSKWIDAGPTRRK